jgi:hypothetical protein
VDPLLALIPGEKDADLAPSSHSVVPSSQVIDETHEGRHINSGFDQIRSSGIRRPRQRPAIVTRRRAVSEQRGHVVVARRFTATATAGRRICRHITIAGSEACLVAGEGFEVRISEVVFRGVRTEIGQSIGQIRK